MGKNETFHAGFTGGLLAVFFIAGMAFARGRAAMAVKGWGVRNALIHWTLTTMGNSPWRNPWRLRIAGEKAKRGSRQWMSMGMVI